MARVILGAAVAVLVALLAGWIYGSSGKSDAARAVAAAELRNELLEARGAVLDARLDLYSVNFGEASRHFEAARTALRAAGERLTGQGRPDDAKRLEPPLTRIDEAQRLAGQLSQDANARAADAAKMIADVLAGAASR